MRAHLFGYILGVVVVFVNPAAGAPPTSIEVQDWYLRESLLAIDDWETVLANWPDQASAPDRIPAFPVPVNGALVSWPHPIPPSLRPAESIGANLQLQFEQGRIAAMTTDVAGQTQTQRVESGATVTADRHPGGGGKSQWYHEYERRFESLLILRPQPAPISIELAEPWNPRFGRNTLTLVVTNASQTPLELQLRCEFHQRRRDGQAAKPDDSASPRGHTMARRSLVDRRLRLEPAERTPILLELDLDCPGGGVISVTLAAAARTYGFALLTHVEDVPRVLRGIEQILNDVPDEEARRELAALAGLHERLIGEAVSTAGDGWARLFLSGSALRDRLLRARIDFDQLLFVKRKPYISEQPFMDSHHCFNRPGGGIYRLSPVRPDGRVSAVVDALGRGIYRDVCLDWNGERLLFAFGNGSDRPRALPGQPQDLVRGDEHYDLFEVAVDGTRLRRITDSGDNDCEPFYLPNGQLGFTSDRAGQVVMCGSDIHVASLHVMEADGSRIQQLGFNVFNEFNPSVLHDGRIIYDRWEYNERSVTSLHSLFTIHPDGSHAAPYYGNATIRPNVIMYPRPVPGSHKVMALFTGHHGQTHGPVGLIDVLRGLDGPEPVSLLTPGVPVTGEKIEDSRSGWYSDPWPLSESTYLCSYTPTVIPWLERSWALYVGDRHGNLALVYRDAGISCAEPVPVIRRATPAVLPPPRSGADRGVADASLLLLDVYQGLPGVPSGAARFLRVLEDVPRKDVPTGGVICTAGTQIYTVKRVLGTVPIESDGSACFSVPANRNLYFQVLDEQRREVQRMRSVVCLKPGERRTCIGCHEPPSQSPANAIPLAALETPARLTPPPWGMRPVSFLRDVQPLITEQCAGCHVRDRTSCRVILTADLTDQFTLAYEELLPFLSVANAMRWDHPEDVDARPAYTYGSNASPLIALLAAGHHGVRLTGEQWERLNTWIDTNAVYYDRYETYYPNRYIFTGRVARELDGVFARRCAGCHGDEHEGPRAHGWRSLNFQAVDESRMLQAPLARGAGGWQRCQIAVFADQDDPDYQRARAALRNLRDQLDDHPRADLRSLR